MLTLFLLFRDYAVQSVVEAVSVKLQQYVYADEEATGKYYHIFILKSYFDIYYLLLDSDYIVLTSSNNEAIVIACLHHSVFRLGSTSSTIAVTECFTDNVINLAMRIQRYIVLQRAGMSVEEKLFLSVKGRYLSQPGLKMKRNLRHLNNPTNVVAKKVTLKLLIAFIKHS